MAQSLAVCTIGAYCHHGTAARSNGWCWQQTICPFRTVICQLFTGMVDGARSTIRSGAGILIIADSLEFAPGDDNDETSRAICF